MFPDPQELNLSSCTCYIYFLMLMKEQLNLAFVTKLLFTQHLKDCLKDDIINMYLNDQQLLAYLIQREEFLTFLPLLNTLLRSNLYNRSACWGTDCQNLLLSN